MSDSTGAASRRCFLPPHIAERLQVEIGHPAEREAAFRQRRAAEGFVAEPATAGRLPVVLYTASHREIEPGTKLTNLSDPSAKNASNGLNATLDLLEQTGFTFPGGVVGGVRVAAGTVHYGSGYDNAFWDGTQMVFGDGDGQIFGDFTGPIDVCGHEMHHGVTGDRLDYQDQAGALNESLSDVGGVTTRQKALGLAQSDPTAWLIGYGLLAPGVKGRALRDMLNPGTAYKNDPQLGDDPQPATMDGYVNTSDDNGGVHTNSGIPNRAFALAALAIGDTTAAYVIWQKALGALNKPSATFVDFARATVAAAGDQAVKVQQAWVDVKVLKATTPAPTPSPAPTTPKPAPTTPSPAPGGGSTPASGCFQVDLRDRPDLVALAERRAARRHESVEAYLTRTLVAGLRQRLQEQGE